MYIYIYIYIYIYTCNIYKIIYVLCTYVHAVDMRRLLAKAAVPANYGRHGPHRWSLLGGSHVWSARSLSWAGSWCSCRSPLFVAKVRLEPGWPVELWRVCFSARDWGIPTELEEDRCKKMEKKAGSEMLWWSSAFNGFLPSCILFDLFAHTCA